jgi:hypothetical protein
VARQDYEVLGVLGEGAFGMVYKARQVALNRLVALKVIKDARADDLARFQTEANAVAELQHPNIVQIYEFGNSEGTPFLALKFVEGGSLARKLGGNPLPPRHPPAAAISRHGGQPRQPRSDGEPSASAGCSHELRGEWNPYPTRKWVLARDRLGGGHRGRQPAHDERRFTSGRRHRGRRRRRARRGGRRKAGPCGLHGRRTHADKLPDRPG